MMDPLKEGRICFIGCGKMGEAMLAGWMASDHPRAQAVRDRGFCAVVPHPQRAAQLAERHGVRTFASAAEVPAEASLVILAVKPQMMDEVLPLLAASPAFAHGSPLVLSIAAGVPCARIEEALPAGVHVIRAMPNMPLQVQAGATVVAPGAHATEAEVAFMDALFCALGDSQVVEESQIDAVCALSGGGPAYFACLAECLAQAGVKAGLAPDLAEALARQTLAGTGAYLQQSAVSLADLRASVCSPGGTTLAALGVMDGPLGETVAQGVTAAISRAKELTSC